MSFKFLVLIFLFRGLYALPFCETHTMDSVFNLGHLIYFLRCGEMWTLDPRLDNGYGIMTKDISPFVIASRYFGGQVQRRFQVFDKKFLNFSGFSIQELSCVHHTEDALKTCQTNIDRYQHLTFLFNSEWTA